MVLRLYKAPHFQDVNHCLKIAAVHLYYQEEQSTLSFRHKTELFFSIPMAYIDRITSLWEITASIGASIGSVA